MICERNNSAWATWGRAGPHAVRALHLLSDSDPGHRLPGMAFDPAVAVSGLSRLPPAGDVCRHHLAGVASARCLIWLMIFCFPDGGDGVVRARIVNRPGESGDRHVVVTFMDDQRTTLRAHADAMNPWAARRLFPSEEYGCEPHQELNAWAVVTTAVSGVAAFAAPPALAAFVPLAMTSACVCGPRLRTASDATRSPHIPR